MRSCVSLGAAAGFVLQRVQPICASQSAAKLVYAETTLCFAAAVSWCAGGVFECRVAVVVLLPAVCLLCAFELDICIAR